MFRTNAHPHTRTPVSPVLFSHPDAQPEVTDVPDADLHRTRQVSFSAAATTVSAARHR